MRLKGGTFVEELGRGSKVLENGSGALVKEARESLFAPLPPPPPPQDRLSEKWAACNLEDGFHQNPPMLAP